ncbi:hypothetical protein KEJ34_09355 [Candidatus Bathyarchaeota archaeon]|nr:hypothetical protein [Candidatus Bathyarchaeota archaeon]
MEVGWLLENYFSHDIKTFSDRSDAFELLLICNRLLKLLKAFEKEDIGET